MPAKVPPAYFELCLPYSGEQVASSLASLMTAVRLNQDSGPSCRAVKNKKQTSGQKLQKCSVELRGNAESGSNCLWVCQNQRQLKPVQLYTSIN